MSDKRNAYHVLGLKKGATEVEIKEAYKLLARRHHPDKNPGDPGAMARFIEIKEAYEELIEKKTSSSELFVKMEEKGHEIRRSGIVTRVAIGVMIAFASVALGVAAWQLHFKDLAFKQGVKAALAGDHADARTKLEPIANAGGPHAIKARDAVVWSTLRAARPKQPADALTMEKAALQHLDGAKDARGLALKGDLQYRLGDIGGAQKSWRAARTAPDSDAETWARTVAGHLRAGNDSEAATVASTLEAKYPDSPWARWSATLRHLRLGQIDKVPEPRERDPAAVKLAYAAAQTAKARTTADPSERDPRLSNATSIVQSVLEEVARASRAPTKIDFYFGLLWLQPPVRLEDPFDWLPSLGVEDPEQALRLAASAIKDRGYAAGAIELVRGAYDIDGRAAHVELVLADILLRVGKIGEIDEARKRFERIETNAAWPPIRARAAAGVARSHASVGRASASKLLAANRKAELDAWNRARKHDPADPEYDLGLALAYASQKNHAQRAAVDRETIKRHPAFGLARLDLALALLALGKEKDAVAELQRATKVADSRALAYLNLGHLHYDRNRAPQALAAYRQVTQLGDPESRVIAWFRIACLHSLKKDRDAAKAAWDNALREQEAGNDDEGRSTPLSPVRMSIADPALDFVRPFLAGKSQ